MLPDNESFISTEKGRPRKYPEPTPGGFAIVSPSDNSTAEPMADYYDGYSDRQSTYGGTCTITSGPPVYHYPVEEKRKLSRVNQGHKNVSPRRAAERRKKNKARRQARRRNPKSK